MGRRGVFELYIDTSTASFDAFARSLSQVLGISLKGIRPATPVGIPLDGQCGQIARIPVRLPHLVVRQQRVQVALHRRHRKAAGLLPALRSTAAVAKPEGATPAPPVPVTPGGATKST